MGAAYRLLGGVCPGVGEFLMYEILVHLCFAGVLPQFTVNDWSNPGPGCMDFISQLVPEVNWDYNRHQQILFMLRDEQEDHFDRLGLTLQGPPLHLLNIENGCCESSKLTKLVRGKGRPRNSYSHDPAYIEKSTQSYLQLLGSKINYWTSFVSR
jgi:hypothetical protein